VLENGSSGITVGINLGRRPYATGLRSEDFGSSP